jgi:hypothetical protein
VQAQVLMGRLKWSTPPPPASSGWETPSGQSLVVEGQEQEGSDPFLLVEEGALLGGLSAGATGGDQDEESVAVLLRGVKDLLELDDHSGAMELLAKAEQEAPGHPEVLRMREQSERVLTGMLESKLGNLQAVPRRILQEDDVIWLNLDHRAGFVLAQIDGTVSYEDLFSLSGMSRLDTARILVQLREEGVIG